MPNNKKRRAEAESDEEPQAARAKKAKGEATSSKQDLSKGQDSDGNSYWEIGKARRVGISEFKGSTLINIREYYTAPDGELRPGKKGISLTLDQYKALLKVIPELNETLSSQGVSVDSLPATGASDALVKAEQRVKAKKSQKPNFEETSEEDDDGGNE